MVKFACGGGNTASAALKNDAHFNSGEKQHENDNFASLV